MVPPSRRTSARTWARPMPCPGLSWVPARRKQVENPLMVLGIDAAPVVGDLENRKAQLGPAADGDVAGNPGLEIFERVIDQIGENLLQRQAIADDVRQRLDSNLGLGLRRPDAPPCVTMVSISSRVSIRTGSNSRRPSRVRLRIADDQPVHLGDRRFDESEGLGEILRELLVGALEHRLGRRRRRTGAAEVGAAASLSAAIRLKMSPRNSSSSLVKPMMLTSGERRSWLTI